MTRCEVLRSNPKVGAWRQVAAAGAREASGLEVTEAQRCGHD